MTARATEARVAESGDGSRKTSAVPGGRLSRLGRMARLATGIAGGMLAEGGRQIAQGRMPRASDLLLTPANARRLAEQLANLRGAAMKMGQLLSMDAGDLLPPQLSEILARLRADAQAMPRRQLEGVLVKAWGKDWQRLFADFSWQPLAAASIGQVHRATTLDGRHLALKIQYPGVARSIDSDVDNVATLLRIARLLPDGINLAPLLHEAKRQLKAEADYLKEAGHLRHFGELLADDDDFVVPSVDATCRATRWSAWTWPRRRCATASRSCCSGCCFARCSSSAWCRPTRISPTSATRTRDSASPCWISGPRGATRNG
jgi:predicted unusual protein kinase regulating ubiquinone biosynthesis (AarF/ABC1/UbiB family)